jgi:4,5:9,10-diseco-3-hydroxy-5,9,17-trioxoandrosta-1(10),2-diene-4-oate hydrolase
MEETTLINGINVYYRVEGKGESLILIHGIETSGEIWKDTMKAASRFFKVYVPDLPGFGQSEKPDLKYGVPFYIEFLNDFMATIGIEKAYIAGISMGAHISASFAATYPERVAKLVLISSTGLSPISGKLGGLPLIGGALNANYWLLSKNKKLFRGMEEDSFFDKSLVTEKMVDQHWSLMKDRAYRRSLQNNVRYISKVDNDYINSLGSIKAPTLVIWGNDDKIVPVADAEKYSELIKGSRLLVLGECGHMVPLEKKEEFNKAILTFLGEVDLYYSEEEA